MPALLLLAATSCIHVGQRLLTVQVELDGQVVFEGIRGVPDETPVEAMWDVVDDVAFEPADGAAPEDPQKQIRSLKGDVVVRLRHVDRELARVSLTELSLAKTGDGSAWRLDADSVERIQRATGGR